MACAHAQGAVDQEASPTGPVNVEEHDRGKDDEQCILNARSRKVDVTSEPSHRENVHDILIPKLVRDNNRVLSLLTYICHNICA